MTEGSICSAQHAAACSFAGLASRAAHLWASVLELCPSLHLNALIHSARPPRFIHVANSPAYRGKKKKKEILLSFSDAPEDLALNQSGEGSVCC